MKRKCHITLTVFFGMIAITLVSCASDPSPLIAERSILLERVQQPIERSEDPQIIEIKEAPLGRKSVTGTGFFVSADGHLVTNYHVVEGNDEIFGYYNDKLVPAKFIKGDPANDLALLKIEGTTTPLPILYSGAVDKGEQVMTLGYPLIEFQGQEQKATFGRINSFTGHSGDVRFYQIDLPVQPGNSGGPLINMKGQVVGIVTSKLDEMLTLKMSGSLPQNVNYAMKSDYLIPMLNTYIGNRWKSNQLIKRKSSMNDLIKVSEKSVIPIIVLSR